MMRFRLWLEMPMQTDVPSGTYLAIDRGATKMKVQFVDEHGDKSNLGEITVERELTADFWRVSWVEAEHGWGPLLYDVAMELATRYGSGLTADYEQRTSVDAHDVWEYYYHRRSDVHRVPLPEEMLRELPNHPTSFVYSKEPTTLNRLKRAGRLWTGG